MIVDDDGDGSMEAAGQADGSAGRGWRDANLSVTQTTADANAVFWLLQSVRIPIIATTSLVGSEGSGRKSRDDKIGDLQSSGPLPLQVHVMRRRQFCSGTISFGVMLRSMRFLALMEE